MYDQRKEQLKSLCQTMKSFTITVDFWTQKYTGSLSFIHLHFCFMIIKIFISTIF
jgi:hypothetical protein